MLKRFSKNGYDLFHLLLSIFSWIDWNLLGILLDWMLLILVTCVIVSSPKLLVNSRGLNLLKQAYRQRRWSLCRRRIFMFLYESHDIVSDLDIRRCRYLANYPSQQLQNIYGKDELQWHQYLLCLCYKIKTFLWWSGYKWYTIYQRRRL